MMVNEDMNQMEPAVLGKNLNMKITGTVQEPDGMGNENHDMTLAVQNHSITAEMENWEYNEDVASLASSSSSTSTREEYPDMDDYDKCLMQPYNQEPQLGYHGIVRLQSSIPEEQLSAYEDQPVESTMGSGTASEDAGSEAGVPTRTSPAVPSLSVISPGNGPILVYASTQ